MFDFYYPNEEACDRGPGEVLLTDNDEMHLSLRQKDGHYRDYFIKGQKNQSGAYEGRDNDVDASWNQVDSDTYCGIWHEAGKIILFMCTIETE